MTSAHRLDIQTVVSALFDENAYILRGGDADACFLVDPGSDTDRVLAAIERRGWRLEAILNTHGHADHIIGNAAIKQAHPDARLIIGAGDAHKLTDPVANLSRPFGIDVVSPPADAIVRDGDLLELGGCRLRVAETPGHSAGHVVFICESSSPLVVIGGDVLFAGSVGRTDLDDGSFPQLEQSIRSKLYTLPDDTVVLPGHGPTTTVGEERHSNPFVRGGTRRG